MYSKILLSVDLHDDASWRKALPVAGEMAKTFGAELHLVTVVPKIPVGLVKPYLPDADEDHWVADASTQLAEFAKDHPATGTTATPHVVLGSIYSGILETAERIGADLIVMGSHRPEMSDYLLGPNAARVVRHSDCSVLVVRD